MAPRSSKPASGQSGRASAYFTAISWSIILVFGRKLHISRFIFHRIIGLGSQPASIVARPTWLGPNLLPTSHHEAGVLVPSSSRIINHMYVWRGGCCTTARCAWAATACGYALPPWRDSDGAKEGCAPHALHPMWCGCVGVPTFARSSAQERAWCALPAAPDSRSAHKLHTTCCCAPCALSDALRGVVACQVRVSSACLIAACVVRCLSPLHTPHNPRRHHPGGSATTPCKLMPQRRGTRCLRQYAATALHIVMSALIGTGQRMPFTGR